MENFKFEYNGNVKIFNKENEVISEISRIAKEIAKSYKGYQYYTCASFHINNIIYLIAVNRHEFVLSKVEDTVVKANTYSHEFSESVVNCRVPLESVNYRSIIGTFMDDGLLF